ncbi:hypothetical protein V8G57_15180 [Collimonas sp. H4R21]|jgi:hypothetical protein|uniref:Lipoprotein n=1 Tax=Collimonas rhizosphaerae TaxID=3126357 RepID=A0ABU9PXJ1_9BURK|nr:hypothetical protein [Collimonas sp. OK412]SFC76208.1 hypothetical protein SAMN04515619_1133 [Collimonas sp. OK412]
MKTLFACAFILPVLSACAVDAGNQNVADNQENVYTTGSNLPSRQNKKSNVETLSPEQASGLFGTGTTHAPRN